MDSSSTYRTWLYDLFPSFYGPDVYKIFLRPLLRQFGNNLITVFNDNEIERGAVTIGPKLMQAIRASRISLVVLSNNYASSTWCLNELLEILKCKEETGQIMMTIFYGVDPSDVQKQTGDFGKAFKETCCHSTEEKKKRWTQALTHVGNIAGEHFLKWDKEPDAIEKMATYVIRNVTNTVFSSDHTMIVDPTTARKRHNKSLDDPKQFVLKVGISKPSVWYSIGMSFVVVIANLLLEIASAVADQLSSIRKPYFARISLVMSILSLILTILDLTCKVRAGEARFRCKWPIPWFYYPSRGYSRIFGSSTDIILSFCAVGQLIVSTINFSFTERGRDGPIKISLWPLFFAIGMVLSKFMEKPTISKK